MSEISSSTITIEAPVDEVREILFDLASYPTWSTAIIKVEVVSADDQNRPTKVKMSIDAGVMRDNVILDYDWSQAPGTLAFSLDDADLLTEMSGSYITSSDSDGNALVGYQLTVGLSMPVPAMMRTKAEKATIDLALAQLKKKIEG